MYIVMYVYLYVFFFELRNCFCKADGPKFGGTSTASNLPNDAPVKDLCRRMQVVRADTEVVPAKTWL